MTDLGTDLKTVLDEVDRLRTVDTQNAQLKAQIAQLQTELTAAQMTDPEDDAQLARLKTEGAAVRAATAPVSLVPPAATSAAPIPVT